MCQDRLMDLNAVFVEVEESVHVDLEEVDKQREVLSIFIRRMCQDHFWTWMQVLWKLVHVDLEEMETERKIVHVHEDLKLLLTLIVKDTMCEAR